MKCPAYQCKCGRIWGVENEPIENCIIEQVGICPDCMDTKERKNMPNRYNELPKSTQVVIDSLINTIASGKNLLDTGLLARDIITLAENLHTRIKLYNCIRAAGRESEPDD